MLYNILFSWLKFKHKNQCLSWTKLVNINENCVQDILLPLILYLRYHESFLKNSKHFAIYIYIYIYIYTLKKKKDMFNTFLLSVDFSQQPYKFVVVATVHLS